MWASESICPRVVQPTTGKTSEPTAVECEQQTSTHSVSQEEDFLEDVYLYQLKEGKSQNPTVALHINGILVSLHLDTRADVTVVTEKHCGKLKANCPLQQTSIAIRSYSGEGKGPLLPVLGKLTLTQGEKEIAEPKYVVKGQGDTVLLTAKPCGRRTDGYRGISPGPDLKHTASSHGRNSARDS